MIFILRVVIAESQSFPGEKEKLKLLTNPPMQIIELVNKPAIRDMKAFARRFPWDWAADIGMIPPTHNCKAALTESIEMIIHKALSPKRHYHSSLNIPTLRKRQLAILIDSDQSIASAAFDKRYMDGNPVQSGAL